MAYDDVAPAYYDGFHFDEEEVDALKEQFGQSLLGVYVPAFTELTLEKNYGLPNVAKTDNYGSYVEKFSGFAEITEEALHDFQFELLAGKLPDGDKNEIAISKYVFDCFCLCSYRNYTGPVVELCDPQTGAPNGDVLYFETVQNNLEILNAENYRINETTIHTQVTQIRDYNDIIGKTVFLGRQNFTITGIIDTKTDVSRYVSLDMNDLTDTSEKTDVAASILANEFKMEQDYGASCIAYVGKGKVEEIKSHYPSVVTVPDMELRFENQYVSYTTSTVARLSDFDVKYLPIDSDSEYNKGIELQNNEIISPMEFAHGVGFLIENGTKYVEENSDVPFEKKYSDLKASLSYSDYRREWHGIDYKVVESYWDYSWEPGCEAFNFGNTVIVSEELFDLISEGREGLYDFALLSFVSLAASILPTNKMANRKPVDIMKLQNTKGEKSRYEICHTACFRGFCESGKQSHRTNRKRIYGFNRCRNK